MTSFFKPVKIRKGECMNTSPNLRMLTINSKNLVIKLCVDISITCQEILNFLKINALYNERGQMIPADTVMKTLFDPSSKFLVLSDTPPKQNLKSKPLVKLQQKNNDVCSSQQQQADMPSPPLLATRNSVQLLSTIAPTIIKNKYPNLDIKIPSTPTLQSLLNKFADVPGSFSLLETGKLNYSRTPLTSACWMKLLSAEICKIANEMADNYPPNKDGVVDTMISDFGVADTINKYLKTILAKKKFDIQLSIPATKFFKQVVKSSKNKIVVSIPRDSVFLSYRGTSVDVVDVLKYLEPQIRMKLQ